MTCRIEGCDRPVQVQKRQLCKRHYEAARASGEVVKRPPEPCSVAGCDRLAETKTMCELHYRRVLHNGRPELRTLRDRFDRQTPDRPDDGCWEWVGGVGSGGYATIRSEGRSLQAHRVSYELFVGPIPEGLHLDHLCRNRRCVNPAHLEPVTFRENLLRGEAMGARWARRTVCHECGGPFSVRKDGRRYCPPCVARKKRKYEYRRRKRAA